MNGKTDSFPGSLLSLEVKQTESMYRCAKNKSDNPNFMWSNGTFQEGMLQRKVLQNVK